MDAAFSDKGSIFMWKWDVGQAGRQAVMWSYPLFFIFLSALSWAAGTESI